ncbi:hypothetical protein NDK43_25990 [Neobacillus pocheonensis]|uniref:Fur-regulated basic protein FbpA n=1 Tax=Neobacillus pocheonensis TaxID=363869 RepID=A0ABT0WFT5_9BACI|nr:hypothetical protein [Neobacillus pocheonensis]
MSKTQKFSRDKEIIIKDLHMLLNFRNEIGERLSVGTIQNRTAEKRRDPLYRYSH